MGFESLIFETNGPVSMIKLSGIPDEPDKMLQLQAELLECCHRFRINAGSRVLVIMGQSSRSFSMGRDFGNIFKEPFPSVTEPIAQVERPVLAGIEGDATGVGLELVLACDVRIASEGSGFSLPHIEKGLMPWEGGTQRLPRIVGPGKALEMILTGELIDAHEAYRIGLVSRLVPEGEVPSNVMKMAQDMASKSPISTEYCKEAVNKGMDLTLGQGLRLEADLYFLMHTTHDREEGIKAFKEKRKPEFKGI